MRRWAVVIVLLAGALLVGTLAASARAADSWRPVPASCVGSTDVGGLCTEAANGGGLWQIALSPDGKHAYGTAWDTSRILLFDRDPATGALTPRDEAAVPTFTLPRDVEVAPDGEHVYVTGSAGELGVFARAADTGLLTAAGCVNNAGTSGCADARGMTSGTEIVLAPGGAQLYFFMIEGILTFDVDADTGALTQKGGAAGCLLVTPAEECGDLTAAGGFARQAAMSPDGESLYLPGEDNLTILDRDPTSGVLTQKPGPAGCFAATGDPCTPEPRLAEAHTVVAGPEGAQVYVAVTGGVLVFARAEDGTLTAQSCVNLDGSGGCSDGRNLSRPGYGAISPDGQHLVLTHGDTFPVDGNGFAVLAREADGDLVPVAGPDGCLSTDGTALDAPAAVPGGCRAYAGYGSTGNVVFDGDGRLYAASYYSGDVSTVAVIKRDFYPACADVAASVGHATPARVNLTCADRNGDALRYLVTSPPAHGTLDAIDPPGPAVTYTPSAGFAGADAFSYRAIAEDLESAPARAALSVAAGPPPVVRPPVVIPPPVARPRVDAPVALRWRVRGKRIKLERMRITELPATAEAELRCKGRRCPLRRTRIFTPSRRGAINVVKPLDVDQRRFRAGQRVDLRISVPGRIGQVLRFNLRRGKQPQALRRCMPIGSTAIRRSC